MFFHIAKYVAILFAGGVATSYAEYRFQYSLYKTITAVFGKKL